MVGRFFLLSATHKLATLAESKMNDSILTYTFVNQIKISKYYRNNLAAYGAASSLESLKLLVI